MLGFPIQLMALITDISPYHFQSILEGRILSTRMGIRLLVQVGCIRQIEIPPEQQDWDIVAAVVLFDHHNQLTHSVFLRKERSRLLQQG